MSKKKCFKDPFDNYKKITDPNELCCPHMMVKASKWGKINKNYYVKTCCAMCKDAIKKELNKEKGMYKIRKERFLTKYNKKTKRYCTVFKLLTKSEIEKIGEQKLR